MRMPSVMSHDFSQVPQADIPRSSFNRSCGYKTSFYSGYLVPVFIDEALPGDTFNCHMTGFARLLSPLQRPIMDNMYIESFFFAVPLRLLQDNWQKLNGEQRNPGDSTDFLTPLMTSPAGGYLEHSLSDYFGIPTKVAGLDHVSYWHRAYNLIWNEWFRDENLQNSVVVDTDDGPDSPTDYVLLRRGKRHDYFTSALPWPQKGPSVPLPLIGNAPVLGFGVYGANATNGASNWQSDGSQLPAGTRGFSGTSLWFADAVNSAGTAGTGGHQAALYANLAGVTAATINQLRQAFQLQRLYERDARGGTRYTEIIKAHFGVTSPDARLQRPEYLGGGSSPVIVSPIAQTSAVASQPTPLANLAAMGTAHLNNHGFVKSFTEHCVIIGMVCARADLTYQQGLPRMFSRRTRFDFYWPALSHIGEQTVLNKEIYAVGSANPTQDAAVFGYQERNAEYRYKPSQVTGLMRSNATGTLDIWHLSQNFASLPVLNSTFIQDNPPVARVSAVPSQPDFIWDSYFVLHTARPMPTYAVPGMIDHF